MNAKLPRRKVLKAFSGVATGGVAGCFTSAVRSEERRSPNDRPRVGVVGNGGIARAHARGLERLADIVAIADVDKQHLEQYNAEYAAGKAQQFSDYRDLIDAPGIDAIFVCTPDHWHVKV
ncbi:MAG: Gfo/Idh/MocA family oxidoreductase, partial [Planctomycetaceae bacterium]|nr:Gfo/Idh/MocA family oxidoreductase [Planctomycetaceae bacterium]